MPRPTASNSTRGKKGGTESKVWQRPTQPGYVGARRGEKVLGRALEGPKIRSGGEYLAEGKYNWT